MGEYGDIALPPFQKARKRQSRISPLVRDWRPGLVGFASAEHMSARGIWRLIENGTTK